MTLYDQLTPKQRRTIEHDIKLIMSMKGLSFPRTIEEMKEIGILAPSIQGGQVYFTKEGVQAIRRICGSIEQTEKCYTVLTYNDVFQAVIHEVDRWFDDKLVPDCREFLEPLEEKLSNLIQEITFVCRIEGITLDGINEISIGGKVIQPCDENFIKKMPYSWEELPEHMSHIKGEYADSLVITGKEVGSHAAALEKFYSDAEMSLSVIRLYSCVIYEHAIDNMQIRLVNTCYGTYGRASCFAWIHQKRSPILTTYFKRDQAVKIDESILKKLMHDYFLNDLSRIINKDNRTELEVSILKSIYWFGEAQKDRRDASKWIKLWSCMECFFSTEPEGISEALARGIASILIYGGYVHHEYCSYNDTKNKIKRFYSIRSKAIHRAEYSHIRKIDLEEFSYIVAFVIITMIPLTLKGYETLDQVRRDSIRLDNLGKTNKSVGCITRCTRWFIRQIKLRFSAGVK